MNNKAPTAFSSTSRRMACYGKRRSYGKKVWVADDGRRTLAGGRQGPRASKCHVCGRGGGAARGLHAPAQLRLPCEPLSLPLGAVQ